jgi:ribonuclease BN (tRNA processing enzyme)
MRLTVIGCGDAFGSGGRFNTCFLIAGANSTILLDCGASSLVALHAAGVDLAAIDGVIISHLHGDHFGGLPFFLLDAQFLTRRDRPLLIAGPPGTRDPSPPPWRCSFRVPRRPDGGSACRWKRSR